MEREKTIDVTGGEPKIDAKAPEPCKARASFKDYVAGPFTEKLLNVFPACAVTHAQSHHPPTEDECVDYRVRLRPEKSPVMPEWFTKMTAGHHPHH